MIEAGVAGYSATNWYGIAATVRSTSTVSAPIAVFAERVRTRARSMRESFGMAASG